MTRRSAKQQTLFPVTAFLPKPYEDGSIYDMVARFGEVLFLESDFPRSDPALGGKEGWSPVLLSKLVVLQAAHGWRDRETVRRARVDLSVKACLGLGVEQKGPSQPTLSRHRQWMQELQLDQVYSTRLQELLMALELIGEEEPVLVDSFPIEGAGQQLDTYNLLAGATRRGLRELAARQKRPLSELARELELTPYLERSVKGHFEVDWTDERSRRDLLARLVADALRVRGALSAPPSESDEAVDPQDEGDDDGSPPSPSSVELIDKVLEHDIERDADGQAQGIRRQAAQDRLISITDPEMRHGRKSASQLIQGFKAQVVATLMFGFVLVTRVIRANEHDGERLPELADEVAARGLRPGHWVGDHAYGTLRNHAHFASDPARGELIARMPRPKNGGRFTKDEFDIDLDALVLTCPAGHRAPPPKWASRSGHKGRLFVFPNEVCQACPSRSACVRPESRTGREVFIVQARERLIRDHLRRREEPDFTAKLAQRPHVERAIAGLAQTGAKRARRFGSQNLGFDTHLAAFGYNLRRLGALYARDPELAARAAGWALAAARAAGRTLAAWAHEIGRVCATARRAILRTVLHPTAQTC